MTKGHLARSVSILGAAYTPMGDVTVTPEIKGLTEHEMFSLASLEAMEDGHIEARDIDAYYVGMSGPNFYSKIKSAAPHFSDWVGMRGKPSVFHDEACATSAIGLQMAVAAVASGMYDCVLSGAVNINYTAPSMSYPPHIRGPLDEETRWKGIDTATDSAYEKPGTGGLGSIEAMLMEYCKKYGVSFSQIEEAVVAYMQNQRKNALLNPKAVRIKESYEEEAKRFGFTDVKKYLLSNKYNPLMGAVVRGKYLGQIVDGASAVVVCATEKARSYVKQPIEVAGIATATASYRSFVDFPHPADVKMFGEAYAMANIKDPYHEVNFMGIHDCPATTLFNVSEAAGYIKPGEAWKYMIEGRVGFDGEKPITTDGGRTQLGHPLAPAWVIEVTEAVTQMRGKAGSRQIKTPPEVSAIWGAGSGTSLGVGVLRAI